MSLYRYDVTWLIPDRPTTKPGPIEVPEGSTPAQVWGRAQPRTRQHLPRGTDLVHGSECTGRRDADGDAPHPMRQAIRSHSCDCGVDQMTDDELQAIKARAEAATPGPWHTNEHGDEVRLLNLGLIADCSPSGVPEAYNVPADAEFIAHARTDVPALAEEVERLRAHVDALAHGALVAVTANTDAILGLAIATVAGRQYTLTELKEWRQAIDVLDEEAAEKAETK